MELIEFHILVLKYFWLLKLNKLIIDSSMINCIDNEGIVLLEMSD